MEVSALTHHGAAGLRGPTPLLRLASDERLVALTRRGNQAAYEALVGRYQSRLLAFCRHMLGSREDAEDVLQEVFAASFNAMLGDDRPINVRPWLYRIARNRSLNHLRRQQAIGVDSMDVHFADHGASTHDKVHKREVFRQLVADVQTLPETQRTALLLREIDALSYDQIAEAMETTVPSVKSLLVRARVSLAEASEARQLTCEQVREELGEVAEGLRRTSPPVRRHVRTCDHCAIFRTQLRQTNKALAAVFPVPPLLLFKKLVLAHLGTTASAGGATAASGAVAGVAASGGASTLSAGVGAIATKTAAGLAAAAIVTAGAVEVQHPGHAPTRPRPAAVAAKPAPAPAAPVVVASRPQPVVSAAPKPAGRRVRAAGRRERSAEALARAKQRAAKQRAADDAAALPAGDEVITAGSPAPGAPGATPATGGQPIPVRAVPVESTPPEGSPATQPPSPDPGTNGTGGATAPPEPAQPGAPVTTQPQPEPQPSTPPSPAPQPAPQEPAPAPSDPPPPASGGTATQQQPPVAPASGS